jgi:hypothetical protein
MSYTSAKSRPAYQFDGLLEFKDAGLIAADAAATVASVAKIGDVGTGVWQADLVIDITAVEVADGNEKFAVKFQGSSSATFASDVNTLAVMEFGDSSVTGNSADSAVGRYVLGVTNQGADGTTYRYVRVYTDVTGTVGTGINYTAFASPRA